MLRLGTKQARLPQAELDAQTALYLREMRKVSPQAVRSAVEDLLNECEFLPSIKELKQALWTNERRINPPVAMIAQGEARPTTQTTISEQGAVRMASQIAELESHGTIDGKPTLPVIAKLLRTGLERAGYDPDTAARKVAA